MEGNSSDKEGEKPPEVGGVSGGEPKVRRKMKTAAQLDALERTYKVETYPSESVRAELSTQLGLSDRQLQMWFCHRRLKDRKTTTTGANNNDNKNSTPSNSSSKRARKGEPSAANIAPPVPLLAAPVASMAVDDLGDGGDLGNEHGSGSGSGSSPYGHLEHRRVVVPRTGVAVPRISHPRYYEPPPQAVSEARAIAFVEAQLGETLREDGPALGIEFDPLPPGAFGAPIDTLSSVPLQNQPGRGYEHSIYEHPDVKAIKGSGRALHEYQFLPEQPTVRTDAYDRVAQPHYYGSPSEGPSTRTPVRSYLHSGEEGPSYGHQGQLPGLNLMPHHGKHSHHKPSNTEEFDGAVRKSPYISTPMESPFGPHPNAGLDTGLLPSERHSVQDEDAVRLERKRKLQSDEVRIQKEVEAHEKRIRKELEKQDLLRRKREEQMRKEMERHDRERRKEEERLLREKQREEERFQREQRREMERREKFLQKENLRAEKLKQKEDTRKEKEAARQKAANNRAAARRLAKESTELIEDERLELMEIAASRKGLQSILALDSETLQNLDSFRDALLHFPPKTVKLKKPFAAQPWTVSEENVGNLLMIWRYFITFADVFGLWPFTIDECVQALHDYDPRLLGEIHIALLRCIIKDIEDVARTPSTGLGANQSSSANAGGGHPQIVEGAYAWGFDIRSWQRHLSPLTWPEILRQFALAAGFGPKLKKTNVESPYLRDDNEGDDGMTTVSNLRNGAAVENAVAIMQERGYSNPRRSRHRLTPGTVKFAAFHVLSLEGGQGLNILDVADKIQKSGLRDLTTSKTPEASIAAALSRDTKLFERVAPSTYCVRTPYRKDPTDAAAILADAREKIRVFKIGFVDEVEADDVEKDDDSESDIAEDPEVDDPGAELVTNEVLETCHEIKRLDSDAIMENGVGAFCDRALEGSLNGVGNVGVGLPLVQPKELLQLNDTSASVEQPVDHGLQNELHTTDQEDNDIDESSPCEPWVQGLMEGDYSHLSVEERLNALVALITVAIEGNSVRVVLEERLEAANALKKQMWAEAQLDKRRLKEENMTRSQFAPSSASRMEMNATTCIGENRQSPSLAREGKFNDASPNYAGQQELLADAELDQKPNVDAPMEKNIINLDSSAGPDNPSLQQSMYAAAERSRAQLKSYIGHKAEEMYVYRSLPLGMDRRRNRYWQFIASASCNDPGTGRIFVELQNSSWRLIDTEEAFDTLLASLDVRGVRESHLHALLQRVETLFKESVKRKRLATNMDKSEGASGKREGSELAFHPDSSEDSPNSTISALNPDGPETSSSFQIESGRNSTELKNIVKRYKEAEEWMWKECFMSSILCAKKYGSKRCTQLLGICDCCHDLFSIEDRHCPTCHNTFSADINLDFSDHVTRCEEMSKLNPTQKMKGLDSLAPVRIRLLKAQLAILEVSLPLEALQPSWSEEYRRSWSMQLLASSSADDLLQAVTALEGAVNKDFLSTNFQTTIDLLASSKRSKHDTTLASNLRDIPVLPWIPQTTAAAALRLMEFDSAVPYTPQQRDEFRKEMEAGSFMNIPSKFTTARNLQGNEFGGHNGEFLQEENLLEPGSGAFSVSKGGRGRGGVRSRSVRGGTSGGSSRSQRRLPGGSRLDPSRRNVASTSENPGPVVSGWKGRSARARGGKKRNSRTARGRPKPAKKAGPKTIAAANNNRGPVIFERSPPGTPVREEDEEWIGEEDAVQMQVDTGVANDSNSEYEYEDNGRAFTNENYEDMVDDDGFVGAYGGKTPVGMMEVGSDENLDEGDEDEEEDEEEDMDMPGEYQRMDYSGGYEQGADVGEEFEQDVDVEGYLNADSEDEGNEDEVVAGNQILDQDEGSASQTSSSEYSD